MWSPHQGGSVSFSSLWIGVCQWCQGGNLPAELFVSQNSTQRVLLDKRLISRWKNMSSQFSKKRSDWWAEVQQGNKGECWDFFSWIAAVGCSWGSCCFLLFASQTFSAAKWEVWGGNIDKLANCREAVWAKWWWENYTGGATPTHLPPHITFEGILAVFCDVIASIRYIIESKNTFMVFFSVQFLTVQFKLHFHYLLIFQVIRPEPEVYWRLYQWFLKDM